MAKDNHPDPQYANSFQSGAVCAFCQESIEEGQLIVQCPSCSNFMHDNCWEHNEGCSSYHCDPRLKAEDRSADIIISAGELDKVIVPPVRKQRSPDEVARQFLPEKPEQVSRLAWLAVLIAAGGSAGIIGAMSVNLSLIMLGMGLCLTALVVGVIALVRININSRLGGGVLAVAALGIASSLLVFYFAVLNQATQQQMTQMHTQLNLSDRPDEEQLNQLEPGKANALRANAVITCRSSGGLLPGLSYGSGVIVRLEKNRAYIMTNKHVIDMLDPDEDESPEISITLYNGEESTGKIEWLAPDSVDIALISCEVLTLDKYRPVRLEKGTAQPSQRVFAIGNPMNLFWSYTEGVISSVRKQQSGAVTIDVYQTQTPINQGNSGGGLYTMDGVLVGINTWTLNKSMAEGLNFSISTRSILNLCGPEILKLFSVHTPKKKEESGP
ncbi:trypsin-like peptidase domain-containing protein [Planctomycetota bacterium]